MAASPMMHRIIKSQDRLFDLMRDPRAKEAALDAPTAMNFDALNASEYALLVTFRRSGEPVPTPVWFGLRGGRAYVRTLIDAGKVKRLRREPRVLLAPCTVRGTPTGPVAEGIARILGGEEDHVAESALDRHYGWRRRVYEGIGTRLGVQTVYLEIAPEPSSAEDR